MLFAVRYDGNTLICTTGPADVMKFQPLDATIIEGHALMEANNGRIILAPRYSMSMAPNEAEGKLGIKLGVLPFEIIECDGTRIDFVKLPDNVQTFVEDSIRSRETGIVVAKESGIVLAGAR